MTHTAGVHLDANLSRAGLGDFDISDFELRIRRGNAGNLHGGHVGDATPGCGKRAWSKEAENELSDSAQRTESAHYHHALELIA